MTVERYKELLSTGLDNMQIAEKMNMDYQALRRLMIKNGVWETKRKKEIGLSDYIELRKKNSLKVVKEKLGVGRTSLDRHREEWGVIGDASEDYLEGGLLYHLVNYQRGKGKH